MPNQTLLISIAPNTHTHKKLNTGMTKDNVNVINFLMNSHRHCGTPLPPPNAPDRLGRGFEVLFFFLAIFSHSACADLPAELLEFRSRPAMRRVI